MVFRCSHATTPASCSPRTGATAAAAAPGTAAAVVPEHRLQPDAQLGCAEDGGPLPRHSRNRGGWTRHGARGDGGVERTQVPAGVKQEEVDGRPVILFLPIRTDQAGDAWDTQLATVLSSVPARFYTPTLKIVAKRSDEVIRVLSTIAGRISLCHALHLDIVAGVTPELAGAMYTLTGTCTWLRGIVRLDCSGAARTISSYQLWAVFLQTFRALCVAVDYDKRPAGLTADRASMLKQVLHAHPRLMYYVSQRDYRDDASRRLLAEVVAASPTLVGVRVGYTTHPMAATHATDLCAEIAKHPPLPARLADIIDAGHRASLERIPGNLVAHMRANRGATYRVARWPIACSTCAPAGRLAPSRVWIVLGS